MKLIDKNILYPQWYTIQRQDDISIRRRTVLPGLVDAVGDHVNMEVLELSMTWPLRLRERPFLQVIPRKAAGRADPSSG